MILLNYPHNKSYLKQFSLKQWPEHAARTHTLFPSAVEYSVVQCSGLQPPLYNGATAPIASVEIQEDKPQAHNCKQLLRGKINIALAFRDKYEYDRITSYRYHTYQSHP